jgi:hypothetical protein
LSEWIRANKVPLIVGAFFGLVLGSLGGFMVRPLIIKPPAAVVVNPTGENHGGEIIPKPISVKDPPCQKYIDMYNALNIDFIDFLMSVPKVKSVTSSRINFSIRSNLYSLDYRLEEVPRIHVAPMIAGSLGLSGASYGAGVAADYAGFGAGVLALFSPPIVFDRAILVVFYRIP